MTYVAQLVELLQRLPLLRRHVLGVDRCLGHRELCAAGRDDEHKRCFGGCAAAGGLGENNRPFSGSSSVQRHRSSRSSLFPTVPFAILPSVHTHNFTMAETAVLSAAAMGADATTIHTPEARCAAAP